MTRDKHFILSLWVVAEKEIKNFHELSDTVKEEHILNPVVWFRAIAEVPAYKKGVFNTTILIFVFLTVLARVHNLLIGIHRFLSNQICKITTFHTYCPLRKSVPLQSGLLICGLTDGFYPQAEKTLF